MFFFFFLTFMRPTPIHTSHLALRLMLSLEEVLGHVRDPGGRTTPRGAALARGARPS